MVPVVAIYSTFLQRAYDQILQDISMQKLHVVLAVDRAGLVGEDGETHHGVFDVGYLRHAPGMTVLAPASCTELNDMMHWAVKACTGPVAVRYPRGGDGSYTDTAWDPHSGIAIHRHGKHCAIITYGTLVNNALAAADLLAEQGIEASVIRLTRLAPVQIDDLCSALSGITDVLIAEEASAGLSEALAWKLGCGYKIAIADLGREYVPHGSCQELYRKYGLDAASLAEKMKEVLAP
jgi:1-deoxy-D-xylulose-5-phosphate synthase